jgi:8-oxo-dGTP diphosphatase
MDVDNRTIVVAGVVSREDRSLICRRPFHKTHGGLWEFPGGKIDAGESMVTALKRELSEELSVTLISSQPSIYQHQDPVGPFLIHFIPAQIQGEPVANEHVEIRWATLPEIDALELAPSDRAYVEFALQRDKKVV